MASNQADAPRMMSLVSDSGASQASSGAFFFPP
jgi:hypothetical protein